MLKKIQHTYDLLLTYISAVLLAAMFIVLIANVILRLIPAVGGFRWYMEFSQYANVWAMLIGAAGVAAAGTNLRVEAVDALFGKLPHGHKIGRLVVDAALLVFYFYMIKSGSILSQRAIQKVSTMPEFTMGQVYSIFPVAGVLCIIGTVLNILVTVTSKDDELTGGMEGSVI